MDTKLQWNAQVEGMQCNVNQTVNALGVLGNSRWGVSMLETRKIYRDVAIPQMMYGCSMGSDARDTGQLTRCAHLKCCRAFKLEQLVQYAERSIQHPSWRWIWELFSFRYRDRLKSKTRRLSDVFCRATASHSVLGVQRTGQCRRRKDRYISP